MCLCLYECIYTCIYVFMYKYSCIIYMYFMHGCIVFSMQISLQSSNILEQAWACYLQFMPPIILSSTGIDLISMRRLHVFSRVCVLLCIYVSGSQPFQTRRPLGKFWLGSRTTIDYCSSGWSNKLCYPTNLYKIIEHQHIVCLMPGCVLAIKTKKI